MFFSLYDLFVKNSSPDAINLRKLLKMPDLIESLQKDTPMRRSLINAIFAGLESGETDEIGEYIDLLERIIESGEQSTPWEENSQQPNQIDNEDPYQTMYQQMYGGALAMNEIPEDEEEENPEEPQV